VRLLGVAASSLEASEGQLGLMDGEQHLRWKQALDASDRMRDRYGESVLGLASGLRGRYRERTHENPADLEGKDKSG
jgi:DNA polymerase-4